jgi:hypothetical protein
MRWLLGLVFFVSLSVLGQEEFVGPLKGWANVKKGFGAKGNGKDDDTKALQNAIDLLSVPPKGFGMGAGAYTVVYLPAGVYCISSSLKLQGKIGVTIIGEDPEHTIIKWIGKDSSGMFLADGSAYFRVSRFSWDANGRKGMEGIGVHWKHKWNNAQSQSFATLNIELADNWFIGGFALGIGGGTTGASGTGDNDSEITIRRCLFRNCIVGIQIIGYNALDYWVWDSRFLQCGTGLYCGYGNYHLYKCYFSGSTVADVHNNNGYYNSIRSCYSVNTYDFSADEGGSSNPFKRVFQDDTVVNLRHVGVWNFHLGKTTLFGNQFSWPPDSLVHYNVYNGSWAPGTYEALSLHNSYGYPNAIRLDRNPNKIYTVGDRVERSPRADTARFLARMDPTPPKMTRRVFEVPQGANGVFIQSILDSAAALKGQRPVVHFHIGDYFIAQPLHIAAGSDMQLIGDGWVYSTSIRQGAFPGFVKAPLLVVEGPSYITIKDLNFGDVQGKGQYAGIAFKNIDQPQAQLHLDQIYSPGVDTSLFVRDMNYLYVEKDNSFFTNGNFVSGGSLVRQGRGTARVCCFGGQFAHLTVQNGGRFVAKDCWWEGKENLALDLKGWGTVSLDGAMIAPYKNDSTPTVNIGEFRGSISLMNMYLQGALQARADNPQLNLLAWNINFYHKMDPLSFIDKKASYKGAFLGLNAQCFRDGDPACRLTSSIDDRLQNVPDVSRFLDTETAATRESRPVPFVPLPAGVSNIYLSRVSFGTLNRGISIE